MITKQKQLFYFVGDQAFKSLEEAQKHDLISLMPIGTDEAKSDTADWLLKNSAAIVDTLTTTPRSRLKGRKSHGDVRKPSSKPEPKSPKPE